MASPAGPTPPLLLVAGGLVAALALVPLGFVVVYTVITGPQEREGPYQLADLLLSTWQLDECEGVLSQLLTQHPQYADAWALLFD